MKVLIIDNYDSFTYNLYQYLGEILENADHPFSLDVVRNDELTLDEIKDRHYDRIIISPGPGHPADPAYFGVCDRVITRLGQHTPVLGVCLGMQGIVHFFGGNIVRARLPMHGKVSPIEHDGQEVFSGLPQKIEVMRYHSLVADPAAIPAELEVTARVSSQPGEEAEIMGIRHKKFPIEGIQFHPESFGTEGGKIMLKNFIFPPARS